MIATCEARYAEGHVMKTAHRTNDRFSAQTSLDAIARRDEVDRWISAGARTPVPPSTDANSDAHSDEALLTASQDR